MTSPGQHIEQKLNEVIAPVDRWIGDVGLLETDTPPPPSHRLSPMRYLSTFWGLCLAHYLIRFHGTLERNQSESYEGGNLPN